MKIKLLNLDLRAGCFDLLLDLVSFLLGHAFLDRLGSTFHQSLRFGPAQSRNSTADFLNDADLVRAHLFLDNFEGAFLPSRCRATTASRRSSRNGYRRRCAHAPIFLELFYQTSNLEHG